MIPFSSREIKFWLLRQGSLAQLDTKNPVMYLDFPNGRLKFFGTLVFPENKYLALKFGPKEVLCEDAFESMVRRLVRIPCGIIS